MRFLLLASLRGFNGVVIPHDCTAKDRDFADVIDPHPGRTSKSSRYGPGISFPAPSTKSDRPVQTNG